MSASRERLLDVMLEEELGGVRPPDLTLRVLAAAREQERQARPTLLPHIRSHRAGWAAAAAILLLGLAIGLLVRNPAVSVPLKVVSDIALLTIDPDGPTRRGTSFGAGSVVHAGDTEARLRFPGDVEVVLQPGSFVRIGGTAAHPSLTYGSGRVTIKGGSVPLAIVLPAGTMQIASEANGSLDRIEDPEGTVEPDDGVLWVASEGTFNVSALTAEAAE